MDVTVANTIQFRGPMPVVLSAPMNGGDTMNGRSAAYALAIIQDSFEGCDVKRCADVMVVIVYTLLVITKSQS